MSRRELLEHPTAHRGEADRQGGRHEIWLNPATGATAAISPHRTLRRGTVRSVCRALAMPLPPGL